MKDIAGCLAIAMSRSEKAAKNNPPDVTFLRRVIESCATVGLKRLVLTAKGLADRENP